MFSPNGQRIAYRSSDGQVTLGQSPMLPEEVNIAGVVDMRDYDMIADCTADPGALSPPTACPAIHFAAADFVADGDMDLREHNAFQSGFPSQ